MENTRIEDLLLDIEQTPLIQNYMTGRHLSNGDYVLPITHYVESKEIRIMVMSDRNVFTRFMNKIYNKYKDIIIDKYYWTSDGSCPNEIIFYLK